MTTLPSPFPVPVPCASTPPPCPLHLCPAPVPANLACRVTMQPADVMDDDLEMASVFAVSNSMTEKRLRTLCLEVRRSVAERRQRR